MAGTQIRHPESSNPTSPRLSSHPLPKPGESTPVIPGQSTATPPVISPPPSLPAGLNATSRPTTAPNPPLVMPNPNPLTTVSSSATPIVIEQSELDSIWEELTPNTSTTPKLTAMFNENKEVLFAKITKILEQKFLSCEFKKISQADLDKIKELFKKIDEISESDKKTFITKNLAHHFLWAFKFISTNQESLYKNMEFLAETLNTNDFLDTTIKFILGTTKFKGVIDEKKLETAIEKFIALPNQEEKELLIRYFYEKGGNFSYKGFKKILKKLNISEEQKTSFLHLCQKTLDTHLSRTEIVGIAKSTISIDSSEILEAHLERIQNAYKKSKTDKNSSSNTKLKQEVQRQILELIGKIEKHPYLAKNKKIAPFLTKLQDMKIKIEKSTYFWDLDNLSKELTALNKIFEISSSTDTPDLLWLDLKLNQLYNNPNVTIKDYITVLDISIDYYTKKAKSKFFNSDLKKIRDELIRLKTGIEEFKYLQQGNVSAFTQEQFSNSQYLSYVSSLFSQKLDYVLKIENQENSTQPLPLFKDPQTLATIESQKDLETYFSQPDIEKFGQIILLHKDLGDLLKDNSIKKLIANNSNPTIQHFVFTTLLQLLEKINLLPDSKDKTNQLKKITDLLLKFLPIKDKKIDTSQICDINIMLLSQILDKLNTNKTFIAKNKKTLQPLVASLEEKFQDTTTSPDPANPAPPATSTITRKELAQKRITKALEPLTKLNTELLSRLNKLKEILEAMKNPDGSLRFQEQLTTITKLIDILNSVPKDPDQSMVDFLRLPDYLKKHRINLTLTIDILTKVGLKDNLPDGLEFNLTKIFENANPFFKDYFSTAIEEEDQKKQQPIIEKFSEVSTEITKMPNLPDNTAIFTSLIEKISADPQILLKLVTQKEDLKDLAEKWHKIKNQHSELTRTLSSLSPDQKPAKIQEIRTAINEFNAELNTLLTNIETVTPASDMSPELLNILKSLIDNSTTKNKLELAMKKATLLPQIDIKLKSVLENPKEPKKIQEFQAHLLEIGSSLEPSTAKSVIETALKNLFEQNENTIFSKESKQAILQLFSTMRSQGYKIPAVWEDYFSKQTPPLMNVISQTQPRTQLSSRMKTGRTPEEIAKRDQILTALRSGIKT